MGAAAVDAGFAAARRRRTVRAALALAVVLAGLGGAALLRHVLAPGMPFRGRLEWTDRMRGAWFAERSHEPLTSPTALAELERMRGLGIEWIAVSWDVWMPDVDQPVVQIAPDPEIREILELLVRRGFRVFFLPRLECESFYREKDPSWRGDIAMATAAEWDRFHDQLEAVTVHYARLAAETGVALYGIGLEYIRSTTAFPERWRRIAAAVRQVYRGKITYSANWYREYEEVEFWDALDYIGVGSYFPLIEKPGADDPEAYARGWERIREKLEALVIRWQKPLIFTEVGYPSYTDAAWRPWEWTRTAGKVVDTSRQAECYRALFRHLDGAPWFHGMFLWRYYNYPSTVQAWDYSPQGKEAERVLSETWRKP